MVNNTLKMDSRLAFRIQHMANNKAVLWIDSAHNDAVKNTMPGVIAAEETDRSIESFVHTREYAITLDPLATTPDHAMSALAGYLNAALGIEPSPTSPPSSALPDLLANGDTNPPAPIPQEL